MNRQPLPIDEFLPQIQEIVQSHSTCVIVAEPGAGKTTRVPVALSQSGGGRWIVLQPRRWAARLTATRIAEENGFSLGVEVGFQIRFENRSSAATRILLMTEGLLIRKLLEDPELQGVSGVILDEFHERSLDLDLSLALLKEIQSSFRPDLKLVVMSATLDPAPLLSFLPNSRSIQVPGRVFPVEKRYLAKNDLVAAVKSILPPKGDTLVFLPGAFEIDRAVRELKAWVDGAGLKIEVQALYSSLPEAEQRRVFERSGSRKIICSTNIAETSITLPEVRAVVDSGLQKVMRMDPALGFDRLETLRISRASAEQRAGRAGRVAPGVVLRLWSEGEQEQMRHFETPEVQRLNLGRALLTLLEFGIRDFQAFDWFERPKASMLEFARRELRVLGFCSSSGITELGRRALRLPLEPSIAALVLQSDRSGVPEWGIRLAAFLESGAKADRICDEETLIRRLNRLTQAESRVARQINGGEEPAMLSMSEWDSYEAVLMEAGRPRIVVDDKVVGRRKVRSREGRLPESFFILSAMDHGDLLVSSYVPISRKGLVERAKRGRRTEFDERTLRVRAFEALFFEDLEVSPITEVMATAEEAEGALFQYLESSGMKFLERLGAPLSGLLNRIRFLKLDLDWATIFQAMIQGRRRLDDVTGEEVGSVIRGLLQDQDLRQLEREAPDRILVPSGSWIPIDYSQDPPRMAVRLQEVFGWSEGPKVGREGIPVLMELLSPGFRPIQVTRDLKSFWSQGYFEVRRELRARYPKHSWPEDPWTAKPEAKGRRRS